MVLGDRDTRINIPWFEHPSVPYDDTLGPGACPLASENDSDVCQMTETTNTYVHKSRVLQPQFQSQNCASRNMWPPTSTEDLRKRNLG